MTGENPLLLGLLWALLFTVPAGALMIVRTRLEGEIPPHPWHMVRRV